MFVNTRLQYVCGLQYMVRNSLDLQWSVVRWMLHGYSMEGEMSYNL
jgi:hypothetical protein